MSARPTRRRSPSLARVVTGALGRALLFVLGACLVVLVSAAVDRPAASSDRLARVLEPTPGPEARLMERFDCSTLGYGDRATPVSALVRGPQGRVRVVSFDEGWAAWTDRSDLTTLVAVCLRPEPAR